MRDSQYENTFQNTGNVLNLLDDVRTSAASFDVYLLSDKLSSSSTEYQNILIHHRTMKFKVHRADVPTNGTKSHRTG